MKKNTYKKKHASTAVTNIGEVSLDIYVCTYRVSLYIFSIFFVVV